MDIQGPGYVLRLDLRVRRDLYCLNLELDRIAVDFLRTDRRCDCNLLER